MQRGSGQKVDRQQDRKLTGCEKSGQEADKKPTESGKKVDRKGTGSRQN